MAGFVALQFAMMLLGGLESIPMAIAYWTVSSFLLMAGSRWAGLTATLIAYAAAVLVSIFQGILPNWGYAVYFFFGAAMYVSLISINMQRSALWGLIVATVMRAVYLWLVFDVLSNMSGQAALLPELYLGIVGWPQWVGSFLGGLAASPILFHFFVVDTILENGGEMPEGFLERKPKGKEAPVQQMQEESPAHDAPKKEG